MNRARHSTRRTVATALIATALVAAAVLGPSLASGVSSSSRAFTRQPEYNTSTLELVGNGSYRDLAPHVALRVEVCLRHRAGGRFFDVRCVPATGGKGKRVAAVATVPGCVKGRWKTAVSGETLYKRGGAWSAPKKAVSRYLSC